MPKQLWQPGQSGNPKGRPPKGRALTEILERAASKTLQCADGKRVAKKRLIADLVVNALVTGQVTFWEADAERIRTLVLDFPQWFDIMKFFYDRVDGPPRQVMALEGSEDSPPMQMQFVEVVRHELQDDENE